uniref:Uncharacterized protein n=1 Tax=Lepeophtheirus salmonis TaxID=72036 RepID=A0A0K2TKB7_LEPSM
MNDDKIEEEEIPTQKDIYRSSREKYVREKSLSRTSIPVDHHRSSTSF